MNKLKTVSLQGKDYATVAERLRQFREDCPRGLIKTEPTILDDGQIMFKTTVVKDKSDPDSAEATGHAMGEQKGAKAFEKLESISVGRSLALLGYAASGEIASSEEMEEFYSYKKNQVEEAIDKLNQAETIDDLKKTFLGLGNLISEKAVQDAKDKRKAKLVSVENLPDKMKSETLNKSEVKG